jgi:hypothetical protein
LNPSTLWTVEVFLITEFTKGNFKRKLRLVLRGQKGGGEYFRFAAINIQEIYETFATPIQLHAKFYLTLFPDFFHFPEYALRILLLYLFPGLPLRILYPDLPST